MKTAVVESIANTTLGWLLSVTLCQWVLFPTLSLDVSIPQNLSLTLALTGVSLLRNYLVRAGFAWIWARKGVKINRPE